MTRLGLEAQIAAARDQAREAEELVDVAETERDVAREQLAQLRQELDAMREQVQEQRSRADRAEALLTQLQPPEEAVDGVR